MAQIIARTGNRTAPGTVKTLIGSQFVGGVALNWTLPDDRDVDYVEIVRAQSNDRNNITVVGKSYSTVFQDIADSGTYYYWVRCVNTSGVKGNYYPTSATGGLQVATYLGSSLGTSFPVGDFGNFDSIRDVFNPNVATGPQHDCQSLDGVVLNIDLGSIKPSVLLGDFGSIVYDVAADILEDYDWGNFTALTYARECGVLTASDVPVALGDFGFIEYRASADLLAQYNWGGFATATLTRDLGSV
jgi:hypothetical protein